MSEKSVYNPGEDQEKKDCKEFAELLCSKYEPSDAGDAIVFTPKYIIDRFEETFDYRPEATSLHNAMYVAGFSRQMHNSDEDEFTVGYAVKRVNL